MRRKSWHAQLWAQSSCAKVAVHGQSSWGCQLCEFFRTVYNKNLLLAWCANSSDKSSMFLSAMSARQQMCRLICA